MGFENYSSSAQNEMAQSRSATPSLPESSFFTANAIDKATTETFSSFNEAGVNVASNLRPVFNSTIKQSLENVYRDSLLAAERTLRKESVENPKATVKTHQEQVKAQIDKDFEAYADRVTLAITAIVRNSLGSVSDRTGKRALFVTESNFPQVLTAIQGIALLQASPESSQLIAKLAGGKPLDEASLNQTYALLANCPQNAVGQGINLLATNKLNQGLESVPVAQKPLVETVTALQVMNSNQAKQLIEFGMKTNSADLPKVVEHLVANQVVARGEALRLSNGNKQVTDLLQGNLVNPTAQALENMKIASTIASKDISNPGLNGKKMLALAGFYGSALSATVTAIMAIASKNPAGVVGGLPQVMVATGLFQYLQGKNPLDMTQPLVNALSLDDSQTEKLTSLEARNQVLGVTKSLTPANLKLLTNPKFIQILNETAEKPEFSLSNFEARLKGCPELNSAYLVYSKDYSANRDILATQLTSLSQSYQVLKITNPETYIEKAGKFAGISLSTLQTNPSNNV